MRTLKTAVVLAASLLLSTLAQAHPKLLTSTPTEGADGAAPDKIELHFSENLMTQFSGAKLLMTEMPGMAHSPMPMKARVSAGSDPKTMLVTPLTPLSAGTYKVEWRAVSSDTHPITGNITFKVK
ncbi:copper homeostasis periplasmic binding protein CopC [Pseudomonas sp. B2M1-30]|uniref:copper homeostasis periplasmic binding protein CopC n=1 Tax=Pseudomonas TaxID=286 RepID=UPI0021C85AB6|nr:MULTISPECIES: copper homeostasis periplasmic binding protein CopC [Pseudomonas]MCU0121343.1 copper homeostasis periplasmic binding protein CopC [Pseudomonas sp. B2M1-30]MCU7261196.1 copper homeostasis periplasmic binding protein CopC [Pseudomonas koreensis]